MLSLSARCQSACVLLLLVLQLGFISAEGLWMSAAEVEHHHLLTEFEFSAQFQPSEEHPEGSHHCDICHGYGAHFALKSASPNSEPAFLLDAPHSAAALPYSSLRLQNIDRPPIFFA